MYIKIRFSYINICFYSCMYISYTHACIYAHVQCICKYAYMFVAALLGS